MQIDHTTVGESFSKFNNGDFIEIDSITCLDYGVSYKFNRYNENKNLEYKFLDIPLKKIALRVREKRILDTYLLIKVPDVDDFYYKLYEVYGAAQQGRISNDYLNQKQYKESNELNFQNNHTNFIDLIPADFSEYKYFKSLTWFDIETILLKEKKRLHFMLVIVN